MNLHCWLITAQLHFSQVSCSAWKLLTLCIFLPGWRGDGCSGMSLWRSTTTWMLGWDWPRRQSLPQTPSTLPTRPPRRKWRSLRWGKRNNLTRNWNLNLASGVLTSQGFQQPSFTLDWSVFLLCTESLLLSLCDRIDVWALCLCSGTRTN